MFRGPMMQTIKTKYWFSSAVEIVNGVQDGRHFKAGFNLKSKSQLISYFLIVFNSGCIWGI